GGGVRHPGRYPAGPPGGTMAEGLCADGRGGPVSPAYQYYLITLLIFFGVNTIACWSLNIQYGVGGVMNFAFIMFQALGAYLGGVLTLGPSTGASFQQYVFGAILPFPLPWLVAAAAGAVLAWIVGSFALRPARRDFQAMVMLVVSIIASTVVLTEGWLFNGMNGIAAVPKPFQSLVNLGEVRYGGVYLAMTAGLGLPVSILVDRLTRSPR